MIILPGDRSPASERRSTTFTGVVWATPLISDTDGVAIASIFFAPGGPDFLAQSRTRPDTARDSRLRSRLHSVGGLTPDACQSGHHGRRWPVALWIHHQVSECGRPIERAKYAAPIESATRT
jgi:hypothetical protein